MGDVVQLTTWNQVKQAIHPKFFSLNQNHHPTNNMGFFFFLHEGGRITGHIFCQHLMPKLPLIDDLFQ